MCKKKGNSQKVKQNYSFVCGVFQLVFFRSDAASKRDFTQSLPDRKR